MTFQSNHATNPGSLPWQEEELPAALKMASTFACGILLVVVGITSYVILAVLPKGATATIYPLPIVALGAVVLLLASLLALFKLLPYGVRQTRWTPKYGVIAPTLLGQPFDVRFSRQTWARSFFMHGSLRFDDAVIVVEGPQIPGVYVQLGILLVVTLVPLLLFGVGLGLAPALGLAAYLGRKQASYAIPYPEMRDLIVKGCHVSFRCNGAAPPRIVFTVASVDGERLYRELAQRFPAALGGWIG